MRDVRLDEMKDSAEEIIYELDSFVLAWLTGFVRYRVC